MLGRWLKRGKLSRLQHADAAERLAAVGELPADASQDLLLTIAQDDDALDVRLAAIGKVSSADPLGPLLEDPAVAQPVAERIAELIAAGAQTAVHSHPLVVAARIQSATSDNFAALVPLLTSAEQAADLALRCPPDRREEVFATPLLRSEVGLVVLEKKSRGHNKSCNRYARETLEQLKRCHAAIRDARDRLVELDAAISKELNHHPQDANALIVHRQKLAKLSAMRSAAVTELENAGANLKEITYEESTLQIAPDPLAGIDLTIPDPQDDPFAPLVSAFSALKDQMQSSVDTSTIIEKRDELTQQWLAHADKQPPNESQHAVFESFSHKFQKFKAATDRLADFRVPSAPAPLPDKLDDEALKRLIDARSKWYRTAERALDRLHWPDSYAVPAAVMQVQDACTRVDQDIKRLRAEQGSRDASLEELMQILATSIEHGKIDEGRKALRSIRHLQKSGAHGHEHEINALAQKLDELKDWQSFATHPKRDELLTAIQALAENPLSPPDQATRLKTIRSEWNQLGRPVTPDEVAEQARFDALADAAFETCQAYYESQAEQRAKNLEARKALCAQLEAYLSDTDWEDADMRAAETIMRQARQEWRKFHPCERKHLKPVETLFESLQADLHAKVKGAWEQNIAAKRSLIETAQGLLESDDLPASIDRIKALQGEWRNVGPTPRGVDQRLWREFRKICDALFARRDENSKALQAAEQAQLAEVDARIAALEAAVDQPDPNRSQLNGLLAAIREASGQMRLDRALQKRIHAAEDAYNKALAEANHARAKAALHAYRDWDAVVTDAEQTRTPLDAPDPLFADRLAGRGNGENLRALVLEAEIAADIASPPEDQSQRMTLQIELMNQGVRNLDNVSNKDFLTRWCGAAGDHADRGELRERFFNALAARL